ncbi:hypothetical protein Adt_12564 [Abeliophyllum distichum]|uniref:Uncharacterized protein n=1 Tax=Abeliophyllum distichum TaxID=126358 RepID=A0ABD1USJ9_9LAMI
MVEVENEVGRMERNWENSVMELKMGWDGTDGGGGVVGILDGYLGTGEIVSLSNRFVDLPSNCHNTGTKHSRALLIGLAAKPTSLPYSFDLLGGSSRGKAWTKRRACELQNDATTGAKLVIHNISPLLTRARPPRSRMTLAYMVFAS